MRFGSRDRGPQRVDRSNLSAPAPRRSAAMLSRAALALAAVSLVALAVSFASPARNDDQRCFRHTSHVPDFWYTREPGSNGKEYARDCRGCHDYRVQGKPKDPEQACVLCHENPKFAPDQHLEVEYTKGFETSLDPLRSPGTAFEHYEHSSLACRV